MHASLQIPPLEPGRVHLWYAVTAALPLADSLPMIESALAPAEVSRARQFVFERNQHEFLLGRFMARIILAAELHVLPREVEFRAGPHGKPELVVPGANDAGANDAIHFNVSHSSGVVVAAFSRSQVVGVDVEESSRRISPEVMGRVFTRGEIDAWQGMSESERTSAAMARWTLKEAYLKARGVGLNLSLLDFWFDSEGPERLQIHFSSRIDDDPAPWRFAQFSLAASHHVSLATRIVRGHGECRDDASFFDVFDFASLWKNQVPHECALEHLDAVGR